MLFLFCFFQSPQDAYKLYAVLDSEDTTADAVLPQFTATGVSGTFTKGETVVGSTSGAR